MTNHLRLDLDLVELLARVDRDDAANHLGDDNHVSEVGLYDCGFFVGESFFFRFAEFLDEGHGAALEAALGEASAGAGVDELGGWLTQEIFWIPY